MTTPPPTTLGREEALKWFLKIIDGAGGEVRSYDGPGDAANVFSGDFEPTDTWNWANERGLIETSFDSMAETSSARITDAGRTILAALSAQHEADRARIGELEARLRQVLPLLKVCYFASARAEFLAALLNPEQSR